MRDPLAADINIPGFDDVHPIRPVYKTRYSHPDTGVRLRYCSVVLPPPFPLQLVRGPKIIAWSQSHGVDMPDQPIHLSATSHDTTEDGVQITHTKRPKVPSLRNGPEIVVEKTRGPKATRLGCGKGTVKPEERDIALFQLEQ
ncbi:MAG: hypothetical protein Q9206_005035 [Seirophora lacunosa]